MGIDFSIILPARNEAHNLDQLLPEIRSLHPTVKIIVVNDGSTDNTEEIALSHGASIVSHPYGMGNGAAIKSGARVADSDYIIFMDADGQHAPSDIASMISELEQGYEMVVGARTMKSHASLSRRIANTIYNRIASIITSFTIEDLTSGFRAVRRSRFNRFLYLLPNKFSYPTTITMAFIRSGYPISYVPIEARTRKGKSHINPLKDGLRFILIIIKIGSLFSPFKFFTPPSVFLFLTGVSNYLYTYFTHNTFTNMSALLIIVSLIFFMFGLLGEQMTTLIYAASERRESD